MFRFSNYLRIFAIKTAQCSQIFLQIRQFPLKKAYFPFKFLHLSFGATFVIAKAVKFDQKTTIEEADALHGAYKFEELYRLLNENLEENSENPEFLWRMARAAKEMGYLHKNDAAKYFNECLSCAQKAIDLDAANWACHKWLAIGLDLAASTEGKKKRIQSSYLVHHHLEEAIRLNPSDPTTVHLLGVWYFEFANLAGYERKIASWIFAKPPDVTYNQALEQLLKAESIKPNFYISNLLYIAKCYKQMGDTSNAKFFLQKCLNYPVATEEDKTIQNEATKLFSKM